MSLISLLDNKKDHLHLLQTYDKKTLAVRACRCAEHVLKNFEKASDDPRSRQGLEVCYRRMKGEKLVHKCRLAALATHVAAREVEDFDEIAKLISANRGGELIPKFAILGKCWQG